MNNFNPQPTKESFKTISPEKLELLKMEKEGIFLFHGTRADIDSLEPRQAVDNERGPDGEPAIFASPAVDFAIFHAIINSSNFPEGIVSQSGAISHDDGSFKLRFKLPRGVLAKLPDSAAGWVYVFKKEDFAQIKERPAEYKSQISVQPLRKIRVLKRDLPSGIGIL
ncbi:MAG: hypothetical protein UU58_C0001G0086 [Candidatus Nomurabacteria bacterium GW2011_GWA2_41_25]|uniref:Uncharacterized protein n=2 Tax=Candidatus Nomuraibacteriota TaxID=1752729 RepID=A0A1F6YB61_9BACT|nr:MAG: hypothetical protein UU58_C0001G0086 [Candidatus Nomurabacteria bacterium GW2011_GWA2_41_25]OGI67014.1 MAG: hypothetical protein A2823_02880 [Candidatus Nomurabacteria bacterium RIFCSPHIGHO2_01_FULL_41_91]OGI80493.1 MAG: hypothetical protein A3D43_00495 [Candidatus Nomurabacteria bacterium RIFCSPHIGHO2_02_FULL_41_52]OGI94118.1 MAG: hypothetical protein A3A07_02300 [Candidatus Nomurabacteria bacterium RIFCSPLOWO2_01_FULL_41_52]OGJ03589.1 MAG: hypothetical protein A3F97_02285 [Candidatus 